MNNMAKIYHNPRCSKSRETLALLELNNIIFDTIQYLNEPLSKSTILDLMSRFDGDAIDFIRTNEAEYRELEHPDSELKNSQFLCNIIFSNPRILQRPIFDDGNKVFIGRPPENVLKSSLFFK